MFARQHLIAERPHLVSGRGRPELRDIRRKSLRIFARDVFAGFIGQAAMPQQETCHGLLFAAWRATNQTARL
jgi:hypothetical protein